MAAMRMNSQLKPVKHAYEKKQRKIHRRARKRPVAASP